MMSRVSHQAPSVQLPRAASTQRSGARERPRRSGLTLAPAHSPLECEADATADRVMRHGAAGSGASSSSPPRTGATLLQRKCAECEEEEQKSLGGRRNPDETDEVFAKRAGPAPEIGPAEEGRIRLLGDGEPLPQRERAFFEPGFGLDFSAVRIHTDARAATSARELNARYVYRNHVVLIGATTHPARPPVGACWRTSSPTSSSRGMGARRRFSASWPCRSSTRSPPRSRISPPRRSATRSTSIASASTSARRARSRTSSAPNRPAACSKTMCGRWRACRNATGCRRTARSVPIRSASSS